MKHLHLLVSDLLLPQDIAPRMFSGLHLPALEKLLARSVQSGLPATTLEVFLCAEFAASSVAPVRATADGLDAEQGFWMCADPVNLQLQQSQVLLQPNVPCDAAEAAALCFTLNEHFKQDGLSFFAPHPQRWYVHSDTTYSVALTPLRVATGRDVKPFQAQGADALVWKRLANEIQMLLHDHPVNVAREARGLPAINSVWLWGAGHKTPLHTALDAVGGDDALSADFARVAGIPLAASLADMLNGQGQNGLWLSTALGDALQGGDLYAWREKIQRVEREIAQPVWQALRGGRLQTLTLDVPMESGTRRFALNRAGLWKVWHRAKTLATYVV